MMLPKLISLDHTQIKTIIRATSKSMFFLTFSRIPSQEFKKNRSGLLSLRTKKKKKKKKNKDQRSNNMSEISDMSEIAETTMNNLKSSMKNLG